LVRIGAQSKQDVREYESVDVAEIEGLARTPAIFGLWPVVGSRGRVLPHWSGYAMRSRVQSAIHDPIRTGKTTLSRELLRLVSLRVVMRSGCGNRGRRGYFRVGLEMSLALRFECDATTGWKP
jgi:hypothetical protein